jgi:hypothetical protein
MEIFHVSSVSDKTAVEDGRVAVVWITSSGITDATDSVCLTATLMSGDAVVSVEVTSGDAGILIL